MCDSRIHVSSSKLTPGERTALRKSIQLFLSNLQIRCGQCCHNRYSIMMWMNVQHVLWMTFLQTPNYQVGQDKTEPQMEEGERGKTRKQNGKEPRLRKLTGGSAFSVISSHSPDQIWNLIIRELKSPNKPEALWLADFLWIVPMYVSQDPEWPWSILNFDQQQSTDLDWFETWNQTFRNPASPPWSFTNRMTTWAEI